MGYISKSDIFTVFIILLVAISAFGLGRLSKDNKSSGPLVIMANNIEANPNTEILSSISGLTAHTESSSTATNGSIVASRNGTKYYFPNCSGISRISAKNLISFNTEAEAVSAGYEKSSTCK